MDPNNTELDPYDGQPPLSPEEEATALEEVELALEPMLKVAPPEMIPILRERLVHAALTHPYPRQLIKAFAPRKPTVVSGEERVDGTEERDEKAGGKDGA